MLGFSKKNIKKINSESESQRILEPSLSEKKNTKKKITRSHSDLQLRSTRSRVLQHLGRLQWNV